MKNKFHAQKVKTPEGTFDSTREANRWYELKLLQRAGKISFLKRQCKFTLIPAQYIDGKCVERACDYIADFTYYEDGKLIVEDCKGYKTKEYIIKRKAMLYIYGIRIRETR